MAAAPARIPASRNAMWPTPVLPGIDRSSPRGRQQLPDRQGALMPLQPVLPPQVDRPVDEMIERDRHSERQHQREIYARKRIGLQYPAEQEVADIEGIGEFADIFVDVEIPGQVEQPWHADHDGG